ncbi:putative ABC-type transport system involved in lysophospholipase L1 biosynthesis, permease component [Beggiatoa alba B18LD]|uniref:Putative ABC-type transport system involved in lysophospholipase L1 biosynthesis, permease component n=1 Tax=Beggiatoa alba B18LD TaxID=395493 RepID=I3CG76_9GAMM|nr:FtsX-like permease family protein [Beggiatoa alba]EIJ42619.1 putative ABC-type transport system involved in lysophospholipase L1 biosynthesis, permease component [Beggiatoa alba B18LD]
MQAFLLAFRNLSRDWRTPELRILALALLVAVTAVTSVGFFTDRVYQVMARQAADMLGADIRVSSAFALPEEYQKTAEQQQLKTANVLSFPTVLVRDDETVLVALKAVSAGYPLRGELRIANNAFDADNVANAIPERGKVWIDGRLLAQLKVKIGDSLQIGRSTFTIEKLVTYEPDRTGLFFQLAPRILLNLADIAETGLISIGSRVNYQLLIAGENNAIANYRTWLSPNLKNDQTIKGVEDNNPQFNIALRRAEQFLGLAALVAVILAGAAIAVAARHFADKQADTSAIMRCLGASQRLIMQIYLWRMLWLGLFASLFGCLAGWLAQSLLATILATFIPSSGILPTASFSPLFMGVAVGFITLLGFALPPILRIHAVPPLRVLRHELNATPARARQVLGVAGIAMLSLLLWQAGDIKLAGWLILGVLLTLVLLSAVAYGLVYSLRGVRDNVGVTWRFGLSNLTRRLRASSIQLTAFGLGIMALLLLAVVRVDLLNAWQRNIPEGTPNYFLVNIQPEQVEPLKAYLEKQQLTTSGFYPMAVGRFVSINGKPLVAENYDNDRARRFTERTFNLSSAATLPKDNEIIEGVFQHDKTTQELSVEEDFARDMGIKMGDVLRFSVGGQEIEGKVTSLRQVKWDTFNVNFFVLGSPDTTVNLPRTYVTSFYLSPDRSHLMPDLARTFNGVTVFDLNVILQQVRTLMDRAVLGIQYVFLFTLLSGVMVLYAALSATYEERLYESAILRTLGATRRQVLMGLLSEFSLLGGLAGLLAASVAGLIGWILAVQIFELSYSFNPILWLIGIVGGALGVGLAGLFGTRKVLHKPPLMTLRHME